MIRRSVAGAILGISLLVGSLAWWGFVALRTVLDPGRSREVAEELLDNEEVRLQLVDGIAGAIAVTIPAEVPVEDAAVQAAAQQALNSPELEALVLAAFTQTHAAFLGDGDAPENLDLTAVAVSAREALVQASPSLDVVLPAAPALNIPLPTEHVPDASPLRTFLQRVVPILAIVSIGGAVVALVSTTDRPSILRRAGFWALMTTAVYLIIGLGVPWALRRLAPDGTEVVAALLTAMLRSVRMPSIVLGVVGAGLLASSVLWSMSAGRSRRGTTDRRVDRDAPHRRSVAVDQVPRRAASAATAGSVRTPPPQPSSPYQGGGGSPYPGGSPPPGRGPGYPDAQPRMSPEPTVPMADPASVFADVPPPRDEPPRPAAGPATTGVGPEAPLPGSEPPRPTASPATPAGGPEAPLPSDAPPRPTANASTPAARPDVPFAPRWVDGHGWVLHPDDPRPVPTNATWVEGVGHVVPGPPPAAT